MDRILPMYDIVMITVAEEEKTRGVLSEEKLIAIHNLCKYADAYIDEYGNDGFGVEYAHQNNGIKIVLTNEDGTKTEFSIGNLWS
mgnify:CR=1 FL=1